MAKHLTEDEIKFFVDVESAKAQQAIHDLEKASKKLRYENNARMKKMIEMEAAGKKETEAYKNLKKTYQDVSKEITANAKEIARLTGNLNINHLTMSQLRKEANQLRKQMDDTSKALNPQAYAELEKRLSAVKGRMAELNQGSTSLKEIFLSKANLGFLMGSGVMGLVTKGLDLLVETVGSAVGRIKDLVTESVNAARAAEGITHAFERMDQPGLLDNLRKATHGTVSDLELMKAAVQAQDFRLPLDQLGKYLEFAQLKAQQTGQSVDYLVNSIVTGLGRKSVMILDNLGLSAAEINEQMAKGGDMATAVGRIIDQQLDAQGEHFETAAEREERATTNVTNAQLELGNQMQKTFGIGSTSFSEMQAKAEVFILKGLTKLIIYCQDLYRRLGSVRAAVETVKVVFDTVFKVCEVGFLWLIDTVKGVGRLIRDLGGMVEGVFTLDWDKIKTSWNDLGKGLVKTMVEFVKDGKNVGERWGQNVVDSINATMGKAKINSPRPANELEGITVTGTRKDKDSHKKNKKDHSAADRRADKDNLKLQKEARQQLLDQEKYFNDASLRAYKQQLAERQLSQSQFDAIQLSLATAHADRIVSVEKDQLEKIRAMTFKDKKQREAAILEQQRNVEKAENDAYNARTAAYQNFQRNMQQLETGGMNSTEREEQAYQLQLKTLEGYYQASLDYAREHNQSLLAIDEAYQQAKEKLETNHAQRLEQQKLQIRQQYQLTTQSELMKADLDALLRQYDEGLISLDDYYKAREEIERRYEERRQQIRQQYGLTTKAEEYQQQLDQLRQYLDQELITTEEYEKAKKQLRMQNLKESFDYWQNQVSGAVNALQDAELANVEAKYDAEIAAAKKAGKDTTELENKKEAEKLKIQKKYADVNFAIKCAEIISNTAVSIMKALAELGPIAGPIAAALMGVTGAAQLAIAKAERDRVKNMTAGSATTSTTATASRVATGLESGGSVANGSYVDIARQQDGQMFHAKYDPRRRGYVSRPTVIVGEGPAGRSKEWVASNDAVENPTVRPIIDAIDQAQRAGNVRTLDLRKVLMQQGLATGGYLAPGATGPATTISGGSPSGSTTSSPTLDRLADVLDRMERNGIPALVGIDQVEASQKLRDNARKIALK